MSATFNVLSVGTWEANEQLREALRLHSGSTLIAVHDYAELCCLTDAELCQAAVLHSCSPDRNRRREAEYIRRNYPHVAIVIVEFDPEALDDPLYDERVMPGAGAEVVVRTIEKVIERRNYWKESSTRSIHANRRKEFL